MRKLKKTHFTLHLWRRHAVHHEERLRVMKQVLRRRRGRQSKTLRDRAHADFAHNRASGPKHAIASLSEARREELRQHYRNQLNRQGPGLGEPTSTANTLP